MPCLQVVAMGILQLQQSGGGLAGTARDVLRHKGEAGHLTRRCNQWVTSGHHRLATHIHMQPACSSAQDSIRVHPLVVL